MRPIEPQSGARGIIAAERTFVTLANPTNASSLAPFDIYTSSDPIPFRFTIESVILSCLNSESGFLIQIGTSRGAVTDEASRAAGQSLGSPYGTAGQFGQKDAVRMATTSLTLAGLSVAVYEPGTRLYAVFRTVSTNQHFSATFILARLHDDTGQGGDAGGGGGGPGGAGGEGGGGDGLGTTSVPP